MLESSFLRNRSTDTDLGRAETLEDVTRLHDPPPGVNFTSAYENELWTYFMNVKPYKEWTSADLFLVAQVVRLESWIMKGRIKLQEMIDDGADLFDPESYACSYNKELMKVESQQRMNMKALGFTRTAVPSVNTGTENRRRQKEETVDALDEFQDVMGGKDQAHNMLAM